MSESGVTELDLVVGSLYTSHPDENRVLYEEEREWLSDVQDLLREEGVEADLLSNPGAEIWEGGIDRFMDLYELRLLAAYLENGKPIETALSSASSSDSDGEPDPILAAIWEGDQSTRFPHLINHQAEGGYYLPTDFQEPVWLEFDTEGVEPENIDDEAEFEPQVVSFGSSVALQRELVELEQMLRDAHVPVRSAPFRCLLVLREAAQHSISSGLPIIIW